jgi:chemotaxis protein histidine kinase CheA
MSAHLVTQFAEDQPLVLVVGVNSWVLSQVEAQFRRYDFAVVITAYSELTTALLLSQQWYKVVVVAGFEFEGLSVTQEALQTLKSRLGIFKSVAQVRPSLKNSVLFVTPTWTHFSDEFSPFAQQIHRFQVLIAQHHPEIHQVFIENLVVHTQLAELHLFGAPHLHYFLQSKASKKIVVPVGSIPLLSKENCVTQLGEILRRPMRGNENNIKISGIVFKNQEIAQELARRFYVQYGVQFEIVTGVFSDSRENKSVLNAENESSSKKIISTRYSSHSQYSQESLPQILSPLFETVFITKDALFEPIEPKLREQKVKQKDDQKLEQKLEQKFEQKFEQKLEQKMDEVTVSLKDKKLVSLTTQQKPTQNTPTYTIKPEDFSPKTVPKLVTPSQPSAKVKVEIKKLEEKSESSQVESLAKISKQEQARPEQVRPEQVRPEQVKPKQATPELVKPVPVKKVTIIKKSKEENDFEIEDKLASLFSVERITKKADHLQTLHTQTTQAKQKNKKRTTAFYVGSVISFFAVSMLLLAGTFFASTYFLQRKIISFLEQDSANLTEYPQLAPTLVAGKNFVELQLNVYSSVLPPAFFYDASRVVAIIDSLEESSQQLTDLYAFQRAQVLGWLGNDSANLDTLPVNTQSLYERLSRLSAQVQELASKTNISVQKMQQFTQKLNTARTGIISYQQFEPLFPAVFGQDGSRTYALVFQNEHELRATGGFIQAVALLTFDRGILIDSKVFSSYQLDNQLAAIVEPPQEIKDLLGENRFYLRDANWDPDFPNSASQIAWFLQQILNRKIDGVVAMNIKAFSQVLSAVGPLELPQYNEVITDKNLAERMEFHSEVTLVETSESNDYSVVLLRNLLQKVSTLSSDRVGLFLSSVQTAISEKQLFVHLLDESESKVVAGLGWNGALLTPICPTQLSAAPCFVDTLAIVDSNIGVNKANFHIKRQDSHTIILSETSARHRHSMVLQNTAQSNAWPKGAYNSYLRVYLPNNAIDLIVKVNGENIALEKLSSNVVRDKSVFGIRTTTPIKSESTITIEYTTPLLQEQIESKIMSYVFFAQKQAGAGQPLTAVSVSYPPSFTPTVIAPQASVDLDSITFTNLGSEHVFVGTTYQKIK